MFLQIIINHFLIFIEPKAYLPIFERTLEAICPEQNSSFLVQQSNPKATFCLSRLMCSKHYFPYFGPS